MLTILFSGCKRDDLIDFGKGLNHVLSYDIETHTGELENLKSYIWQDDTIPESFFRTAGALVVKAVLGVSPTLVHCQIHFTQSHFLLKKPIKHYSDIVKML